MNELFTGYGQGGREAIRVWTGRRKLPSLVKRKWAEDCQNSEADAGAMQRRVRVS